MPAMSAPMDESELLADFDRYMRAESDASPRAEAGRSSPAPGAPTPLDAAPPADPPADPPVDPPALARLAARYAAFDRTALREVLASVGGDEAAAAALLEGAAPATAADAALAAQLQRREARRAAPRHRRNDAPVPLDRPVLQQVVSTLREIVVPALRAHFEELVIPNMRDNSGTVEYALEDFHVSALALPEHNITVKAAPDAQSIRVHVVNIFLELEVGRWSYEGKGLLPVKDAGTARVSVHGMSVEIRLEPRWAYSGGTRVVITACDVTVDGVVRFKTQGAAADWAYNAIAVVLKPLVVSYIKEAVADTVTAALAVHLREWAFSRTLDDQNSRPAAAATNASQPPVTAAE